MDRVLKVGIIGFGNRGTSFAIPLTEEAFENKLELTAIYESGKGRCSSAESWLKNRNSSAQAVSDYDKFLSLDMDFVMVCTPQSTHADVACKAFEAGKNVFLEKPMATNIKDCDKIIEAAQKSGKELFMGFNLRHHSVCKKIKELIDEGCIGKPQNVICTDFYSNGWSYFRRWHRLHKNSGGLMVEKGCHSLDLINWFIGSNPVRVAAFGGLDKFTPDSEAGKNCSNCAKSESCDYYHDMKREIKGLAQNGINADWILGKSDTDLCVFNSDKDTFDNHTAIVEYENNCRATYVESFVSSVKATSGRQFIINGPEGQIWASLDKREINYYPTKVCRNAKLSPVVTYHIPEDPGSHGGADENMLNYIAKCLTGKTSNTEMRGESGKAAIAVAEAAERAAIEKTLIEIGSL
jgi:predicted dehydrogenase